MPTRKRSSTRAPQAPRRPAARRSGGATPRARGAGARTAPRARAAAPADRSRGPVPAGRPERPAPANPSGAVGLLDQHLNYTSQAVDEVKHFYTGLLGFTRFQHDPRLNYLYIQTGPSSSLGFMPPSGGSPDEWRPPREPAIYLIVEDVDRAHAELARRGATFDQPPRDFDGGHRVAWLKDPEGRRVCLAQVMRR